MDLDAAGKAAGLAAEVVRDSEFAVFGSYTTLGEDSKCGNFAIDHSRFLAYIMSLR